MLPGLLYPDAASQARLPLIQAKIGQIAQMDFALSDQPPFFEAGKHAVADDDVV